jgi:hypothetical protein
LRAGFINRATIDEYRKILVEGYPPWYKRRVKICSTTTFNFPSLKNGNNKRGGWILAVGLGHIQPLPYFSSKFGRFRDLTGRHHRRGNGPYWTACSYFQSVIDARFTTQAFPDAGDQEIIAAAREAINMAMEDHSASRVCEVLRGTVLYRCFNEHYENWLNNAQGDFDFAFNLFNHKDQLTDSEVRRLKPILLPILSGAVCGLAYVFRYLNDVGFQIDENIEKMLEDNRDVYLEGCSP